MSPGAMTAPLSSDPFTQTASALPAESTTAGVSSMQPQFSTANGAAAGAGPTLDSRTYTDVNSYPAFAAAYGAATQPYGPPNYSSTGYDQYGSSYLQSVGAAYPQHYNPYQYGSYGRPFATPARLQASAAGPATATTVAAGVQQTGSHVLNNLQDAMTRFARVSAHIDEVLRHLHMLFDAVFGLGYSLGAMREEARMWLANKTGPVAILWRILRAVTSIGRILSIFFLSPMAGRYSPIALVLRVLGLVPNDLNTYYQQAQGSSFQPQNDGQLADMESSFQEEPSQNSPDIHAQRYHLSSADPRDFSNM